jgi:single-stranded DNA-binding protein
MQGKLVADPVQRTASSGKAFVTAQLRVATEDESLLVSVIAFDKDTRDKLARLRKGDATAITGRAKPTTWEKNGEQRHGLSVVASGVLTAYEAAKRRSSSEKPKSGGNDGWQPPESRLDDLH